MKCRALDLHNLGPKFPIRQSVIGSGKISGVVIKYIKKHLKLKKVSIRYRFLYQKVFKISDLNIE